MSSYIAEQYKEKGNTYFRKGDYSSAESCYSQAIQKNASNPLLFTNRANARLKTERWQDAIDDCLRSIELLGNNMKAYFQLAQAQLAINHPNEAMSSALMAYELCVSSPSQTASASTIAALVLKCKKMKWEGRERERLPRRCELLADLETTLETECKRDLADIEARLMDGSIGAIEGKEETQNIQTAARKRIEDLRTAFTISDPQNLEMREVPEFMIDPITFEIMHDPVTTKNGTSYERATLIEHIKRSPTDPLTREPLVIDDLRPNIALRRACQDFLDKNSGWAYDW